MVPELPNESLTTPLVTYTDRVGGNPFANAVADSSTAGSVSATVDALGRTVSYQCWS
ncbi:MAG: hypothetical protein H0U53_05875 [Actinobacteria bacterium]|nr:hypothetical protein [Actinomycetota bacterium]